MANFELFTTLRYDPKLLDVPSAGFSNVGWNQNASPFYLLDLHRDRMLRAASHWGWDAPVRKLSGDGGLHALERLLHEQVANVVKEPHRIKVLVDENGTLSLVKAPIPPAHLANLFPLHLPPPFETDSLGGNRGVPARDAEFEVLVDTESTTSSPFTHFKTTHRPMYDEARHRTCVGVKDKKEVLLINSVDGSVMEGSITTPYFWRNERWVTPPIPSNFSPSQGSGGNNGTTRRWALERQLAIEEVVQGESLTNGEECWLSNGVKGFVHGKVRLLP